MSGDGGRESLRRSTTRFAVGPSMPQLGEPDIFRTAVTTSAELPIGAMIACDGASWRRARPA
jgi:hypothetical protein